VSRQPVFARVPDESSSGAVRADSACHSRSHEALLAEGGWCSRIPRKGYRNARCRRGPGGQSQALDGAGGGGACVDPTPDHGRQAGQDCRPGSGALQERRDEPGRQPAPACLAEGEPPPGLPVCPPNAPYRVVVPCGKFRVIEHRSSMPASLIPFTPLQNSIPATPAFQVSQLTESISRTSHKIEQEFHGLRQKSTSKVQLPWMPPPTSPVMIPVY